MRGRVLAVDVGARRVGLAISDRSGTLARPLETIAVTSDVDAVDRVARRVAELASDSTARVTTFIAALQTRTSLSIVTEGEQLSSREAESRLALRERDWRKRKQKLDAAAAAIILQDYLDRPAS
jgi:putative Holliday junction resolvase